MVSDVLSELCVELRRYIYDADWEDFYTGEIRAEIVRLVDEMDALRARLDKAPDVRV